jgi:O-antigen ligase
MSRLPFKYIFLAIFIILNLFGINKLIPTISLLKFYFILGLIPLVFIFISKFDLTINLLMLFFFFVLFKELGQLPLPLLPDLFPWRLIWIILFVVLAYELLSRKRERLLPVTDIEIAMVMFSVVTILSMLSSGTFYQEGKGFTLNYYLNAYGIPFSIFFLAKNIINTQDGIKKLFIFFVIIGLYLGLTGIFEHFEINALVYPKVIMNRWQGVSWGRARGPFMNSAVNGTAIGMLIFMVIYVLLQEKIIRNKIFYIITLICALTTLLLTLTRGCWIAFMVALLFAAMFIPQIRRLVIASILGLTIIITILFGTKGIQFKSTYTEAELHASEASLMEKIVYRTQKWKTVTGRIDLYKISLKMFLSKPVFGFGYGAFIEAKEKFILESGDDFSGEAFITERARGHDTLIGILVDLGLVGFSFLIYIIFRILSTCKKLYRGENLIDATIIPKDFPVLIASVFIVYLINIQVIDIRNFLFPNSLFFLLAGIIVGIDQRNAIIQARRNYMQREHGSSV